MFAVLASASSHSNIPRPITGAMLGNGALWSTER